MHAYTTMHIEENLNEKISLCTFPLMSVQQIKNDF